jgi:hypothetical protein
MALDDEQAINAPTKDRIMKCPIKHVAPAFMKGWNAGQA